MNMLEPFMFLRPAWLLLLPLPLLAGWWLRGVTERSGWAAMVDARLLGALRGETAGMVRRRSHWWLALWGTLGVLALAGPSWRLAVQPLESKQAGLVIVLDLSQGMQAADEKPSRLLQARYRLLDLLRQRREGQTGLVAYAGEAFTVSPLTDDQATLESLLAGLDPTVMPVDGQRLDRALEQAGSLLEQAAIGAGDVLVVSYAADAAAQSAAVALRERGHRVAALPLGSPEGAPIPLPGGGFVRDALGEVVMSRGDRDALQQLADSGGGALLPLNMPAEALARAVFRDGASAAVRAQQEAQVRRDEGPWLVLLMLLMATWKLRGGSVLLAVFVLLQPEPASAMQWRDLWQRKDQQAHQAFVEGDYQAAQEQADDPLLRGSAAYRAGEFARAAEAYDQKSGQAAADYNRGNALARAGKLEQALEAYEAALQRQADFADAAHNRDVVRQALQQQKAEQDAQQDADQDDAGENDDEQERSEAGEGKPGDETAESESGQSSDQQPAEEQEQSAQSEAEGESDQRDGEAGQDAEDADSQSTGNAGSEGDSEQAREAHRQAMERALQEDAEGERGTQPVEAAEMQDPETLEKAQATEQWLRRIPDDPSGLLRRKFALEYRRRLQEERE